MPWLGRLGSLPSHHRTAHRIVHESPHVPYDMRVHAYQPTKCALLTSPHKREYQSVRLMVLRDEFPSIGITTMSKSQGYTSALIRLRRYHRLLVATHIIYVCSIYPWCPLELLKWRCPSRSLSLSAFRETMTCVHSIVESEFHQIPRRKDARQLDNVSRNKICTASRRSKQRWPRG